MTYSIIAIPKFQKELKKFAKKYPSLKTDFLNLLNSLEIEPKQGVELGKNCYKIRIAIGSKGKGKSGGARVITHITIKNNIVYLLTIFDKSEKESLTDKELVELLKFIID